ncbi:tRNA-His guanylyltransferase [Orbilia oligospora]|uniref:tRNA(His) guanylyltransferase n=1 Tax=Orbilia oligospora TaxID=2813651 RepID=A0A7C8NNH8_ORBOL|nr:tRNA-His guanylyltransferase [Orbilia oligospora]KAF3096685.1 tRNA-His guanylyltransferase [Orbilia oligospora]KAF3118253.1 tRNA-His guanylyltransferase [Orbilia oligospora]KAF3120847.1 tRNA-His guanylyltransferase [Orbilia oligospora]KAF3122121.1 tRNA-His guanylyltransferase [Orbilia oligospora]
MANSKFEYVRHFELSNTTYLLPNTYIIIRIDGRSFHRFTTLHSFTKPNDSRALSLMNAAAVAVFHDLGGEVISIAYGVSDEFSFVLRKECNLFERREAKLVSTIVSIFTAYYISLWSTYFPSEPLKRPLPTFDGRAVCYPTIENVRDYLSWRQADCHINNLYNTTFWALILKGGMTPQEAEKELMGTLAKDKNEILWSRFGVNYNNEEEMFRKGSVVYRNYGAVPESSADDKPDEKEADSEPKETVVEPKPAVSSAVSPAEAQKGKSRSQQKREAKKLAKAEVVIEHVDIIKDAFWEKRPWILHWTLGRQNEYAGTEQ